MNVFKTILILSFLFVIPTPSFAHTQTQIFNQIVKNKPQIERGFALKLTRAIRSASKAYKVSDHLLTAILMQESTYNTSAVRKRCSLWRCVPADFGIGQISKLTAKHYQYSTERLTSDLNYSVRAAAEVLSWFHKTYSKREPKRWFARYNCGTKRNVLRRTCQAYYNSVQRWF